MVPTGWCDVSSGARCSFPGLCKILNRRKRLLCFNRKRWEIAISLSIFKEFYQWFVISQNQQTITILSKIPWLFKCPNNCKAFSLYHSITWFRRSRKREPAKTIRHPVWQHLGTAELQQQFSATKNNQHQLWTSLAAYKWACKHYLLVTRDLKKQKIFFNYSLTLYI